MIKRFIHRALDFFFPQKCLGCGEGNAAICPKCLSYINMPALPKEGIIFSGADYGDEIVKKAVWLLKYRGIKTAAEPLAEMLNTRCLTKIDGRDWLIAPIPLSKKRLRERGYNQAELIAKYLSQKTNMPVVCDVLIKTKETATQVSIKNRNDRLNNLKGCFTVKNPELIARKKIILIDDVCTTGATIHEAKKTLLAAGAKKVVAIVVARG